MRFDILKLFVMISPKEFSIIKMLLDDFLEFCVIKNLPFFTFGFLILRYETIIL